MLSKIILLSILFMSALVLNAQSGEETPKVNTNLEDEDTVGSFTEVPVDEDVEFNDDGTPKLKPSLDIDTYFLFTKPDVLAMELPSRKEIQFLVGFKNNGKQDYIVETIDASFRFNQDFSYILQNFSTFSYNKLVKPEQETTLAYNFYINEAFSERSFGFTVNLLYKNLNGKQYANAVFNQTINIVELNEGLTFEILFIYIFLASIVGLIIFAIYHYLLAKRFFRRTKKKIETGTKENINIDYEWIPSQNLNSKTSPKVTPKQKKAKKVD